MLPREPEGSLPLGAGSDVGTWHSNRPDDPLRPRACSPALADAASGLGPSGSEPPAKRRRTGDGPPDTLPAPAGAAGRFESVLGNENLDAMILQYAFYGWVTPTGPGTCSQCRPDYTSPGRDSYTKAGDFKRSNQTYC